MALKKTQRQIKEHLQIFAQNDQALYSLHAYMMYLKFGFGRATQDAGIEIRRAMTRNQGKIWFNCMITNILNNLYQNIWNIIK